MSAADMYVEGTVVISCDADEKAENCIKKIIGAESLPNPIECSPNIKGYPWSLETKYYTADINLYAIKEKAELNCAFCEAVKAIVFYFDNQKPSSFEEVLSWMPFLKNIEAEVQILVCNNYCDASESTALEKKNVLDWCVKNEYELVELNSVHESDDEDERAFKDVQGFERVIQALQAHTWSNMEMKDENSGETKAKASSSTKEASNSATENCASNTKTCSTLEDEKPKKVKDDTSQLEEPVPNDFAGGDPTGEMDFEALFAKFAGMKEKAASLTGDDRKKFAEKAVIEFWRAMGGDEDEIAGLDDED